MFPASTSAGGMCMGMPDVCLTPAPPAPPIPVPYPNIAQCAMANPGTASTKVMIANMPALMLNSMITLSSGDEAGVNGGVVSGQFIGPAKFLKGSSKVLVEGKPGAYLTSQLGQNGASPNTVGTQIAPSQAKVIYGP
jgi:hypothetical protein